MTDYTNISTTKNPVTEQAPATLPIGYLAHGYHTITDKGLKRDIRYITTYPKEIAAKLAPMNRDVFASLFRQVSSLQYMRIKFEHQLMAVNKLTNLAANLVHSGKAPQLLVDFCEANAAVVTDKQTFVQFCDHMEAVACQMK